VDSGLEDDSADPGAMLMLLAFLSVGVTGTEIGRTQIVAIRKWFGNLRDGRFTCLKGRIS
jgi:hypothetical protein